MNSSRYIFLLIPAMGLLLFSGARVMHKPDTDAFSDTGYSQFKNRVQQSRKLFLQKWTKSGYKPVYLDSARRYLEYCVADSMYLFWKNTPWEFYGSTQKPGTGSIACGYFVTTVLRDLDFNIPRVKWAEVASETFIRAFCGKNVKTYRGESIAFIEQTYRTQPGRVFVAGLDYHVGFFIHRDTFGFLHSNYYQPEIGVRMESAHGNNPFASSHYRAIGRLFDDEMVKAWLQGKVWN